MRTRTLSLDPRDHRILLSAGSVLPHEVVAWLPPGVRQEKLLNLAGELGADVRRLAEDQYLYLIDKQSVRKLDRDARHPVQVRLTMNGPTRRHQELTRVLCEMESADKSAGAPSKSLGILLLRTVYACLLAEPLDRNSPPLYRPTG